MSTKSTVGKVILYIIIAIVIIAVVAWVVGLVANWLYGLLFSWWLDPIVAMGTEFAGWAYDTVYTVTDDVGTALGGLGGTVETNLVTGVVNTVGNFANDFINWFVGLFYQANQAFGGG